MSKMIIVSNDFTPTQSELSNCIVVNEKMLKLSSTLQVFYDNSDLEFIQNDGSDKNSSDKNSSDKNSYLKLPSFIELRHNDERTKRVFRYINNYIDYISSESAVEDYNNLLINNENFRKMAKCEKYEDNKYHYEKGIAQYIGGKVVLSLSEQKYDVLSEFYTDDNGEQLKKYRDIIINNSFANHLNANQIVERRIEMLLLFKLADYLGLYHLVLIASKLTIGIRS